MIEAAYRFFRFAAVQAKWSRILRMVDKIIFFYISQKRRLAAFCAQRCLYQDEKCFHIFDCISAPKKIINTQKLLFGEHFLLYCYLHYLSEPDLALRDTKPLHCPTITLTPLSVSTQTSHSTRILSSDKIVLLFT